MADAREPLTITPTTDDNLYLVHQWIEGEHPTDDISFNLTSGCGVGSTVVKLDVEVDGQHVTETFSMAALCTAWVNAVVNEVRS